MRPHRMELTNQLVLGYGLHNRMSVHSPRKATEDELCMFHASDYVEFLKRCVGAIVDAAASADCLAFSHQSRAFYLPMQANST